MRNDGGLRSANPSGELNISADKPRKIVATNGCFRTDMTSIWGTSMSKLDFEGQKADSAQIVEIVKTLPEALQQRSFELLFDKAFSAVKPAPTAQTETPQQ